MCRPRAWRGFLNARARSVLSVRHQPPSLLEVRQQSGGGSHSNGSHRLLLSEILPGMRRQAQTACCAGNASGGGVKQLPEPPMRFQPLAPEVKCPACGADLTFIKVRGGVWRPVPVRANTKSCTT
jgi:hypothetical protein